MTTEALAGRRIAGGLLDPGQLVRSTPDALRKLNPFTLWRNPVMFIVEVGSVFTTVLAIATPTVFAWSIVAWLWLTVIFANLAEAVVAVRLSRLRLSKSDSTQWTYPREPCRGRRRSD